TGRAGRRGIDEVGYAVVLWSPFVTFEQVANLVSTRTFAISSSFRPTYNMAANLVRRYPPDEAHHLLNLSFAQYQADRDIVRLETRLDEATGRVARARAALGDHPVADCPDVDRHRRAWVQAGRIERERASLERQVKGRSASLARQFDTVLRLLETWGYLDGWSLTPKGERLARIYHEADLLIA